MARFIVEGKDKIGREKFAYDSTDWNVERIDFGVHSDCAVRIADPVAAHRHCEVSYSEQGFLLIDLGSTLGTFLNGVEVGEPCVLADGDEILLGMTRMVATITDQDGQPTLRLATEVGAFAYAEGDLDLFVKREVAFGRYPALRVSNWLAVFALLALSILLGFDAVEEPLFDPGPLDRHHALLFEEGALEGPHGQDASLARAEGCMVCHDAFNRTPIQKCARCHGDLMREQHPFSDEVVAGVEGLRGFGEHDCMLCHVDHRGALDTGDGSFIPADASQTCGICHAQTPGEVQRELPVVPRERTFPIAFETFPHDKHLTDGAAVACTVCHRLPADPRPAEAVASRDVRADEDFAPVSFETCMGCHEREQGLRDAELQDQWPQESSRLSLSWHGTDDPAHRGGAENCLQCHAELHHKDLKTISTRPAEMLAWRLVRRDHRHEFDLELDDAQGGSCTDCHRDGSPGDQERTVQGRKFWHALHVPDLEDEASCRSCHVEVLEGGDLGANLSPDAYGGAQGDCERCHDTERPRPLLDDLPAAIERTDFPHDLHLERPWTPEGGLEQTLDCLDCHEFSDPSDDLLRVLPSTPRDVRDCTRCHVGSTGGQRTVHLNLGAGNCTFCHGPGDPSYGGEPLPREDWPALNRFDHFSLGHIDTTREDCAACHADTHLATRVSEVPIPDEGLASCRQCHVEQGARYHWR